MLERIDRLLFENGLNDSELANIAGVSKSTVSGWRSGRFNPKGDKLQKIADHFGVSVEYLMGADNYKTREEQETMDILFDSKAQQSHSTELFSVSAGHGRINGDYPNDSATLDYDYESGEYVDAVIHGDSMHPIIMDGDTITIHIEPIQIPDPSKITVVKIDGEATTVKYVELTSEGIWIRAENKSVFQDRFLGISDVMTRQIKLLGTVVAVKRKL